MTAAGYNRFHDQLLLSASTDGAVKLWRAASISSAPPAEYELDGALGDTGENFAVGGENRWAYSSFVNWEFFPSVDLPILVYFKETQTPQDQWDVGPGQWANGADALAKGAVKGQVHAD